MPNHHPARPCKKTLGSSCAAWTGCVLGIACLLSTALGWAHGSSADSGKTYVLNAHALPLGDGKVSSQPRRGYVYACQNNFRGGGAQHTGNWINGVTWDAEKKIYVQGSMMWPEASFAVSESNGRRNIAGNALPVNHVTGIFPIRRDDPAYQIDRNPNAIATQSLAFSLPLSPTMSAEPSCVPMGLIGVMLNGVAVFNALDAAGRDAVAHEVQDRCNGHPERRGQYHYHGPSACIKGAADNNTLIGYAADGFGIYSMFDANGKELTNADLDECHGRTSRVMWNGKEVEMYHYVLTREYPYTVGCFRGVIVQATASHGESDAPHQRMGMQPSGGMNGGIQGGMQGRRRPPPEAIQACAGSSSGNGCRFVSPRGDTITGTCNDVSGVTACAPQRR